METLSIALPPGMKAYVQEQVEQGKVGSTDEYFRRLIREDYERKWREEVDRKLLEGLDSGPSTPWTAEDLAAVKRQVKERQQKRDLAAGDMPAIVERGVA